VTQLLERVDVRVRGRARGLELVRERIHLRREPADLVAPGKPSRLPKSPAPTAIAMTMISWIGLSRSEYESATAMKPTRSHERHVTADMINKLSRTSAAS